MTAVLTAAPTLTDGTVTLRAHRNTDVDAVVGQCQDEESLRWTTVPRGYTPEMAVEFIEGNARNWQDPEGTRSWAIEVVAPDGARFDIRDGRALCAPAYEPVAKFPVRRDHDGIWTRDDRED